MTKYTNIPEELKTLKQWVCAVDGCKAPMKAIEYEPASSTNAETWDSFETALESVNLGLYDYCGFVFNNNGIVGIDIDDGFDEDGLMNELAADIISHCKSYTELSKSKRGFHILVRGSLPFKGKNNLNGVEIYNDGRYFIMTGNVVIYPEIIDNQEAINYIVDKYFPESLRETASMYDDKMYKPSWVDALSNGRIRITPAYPEITQGGRNVSLLSLAGALHTGGAHESHILNELKLCNKRACKPALHASELESIVKSIRKYRR